MTHREALMQQAVVLILNAGSSSLKYQVVRVPDGERLLRGKVDRLKPGGFSGEMAALRVAREAPSSVSAGQSPFSEWYPRPDSNRRYRLERGIEASPDDVGNQ
jgi:hypothetical protein